MYSSSRGYQHIATGSAPPPPPAAEDQDDDDYDYEYEQRDLNGDLGLPPPHQLPGSAYPGPPRAVFATETSSSSSSYHHYQQQQQQQQAPASITSSGGGGRSSHRGATGRNGGGGGARTFSLPPASPTLGAGVGTYAHSQGAPLSDSSSRRTRNSLPPPNSYNPYGQQRNDPYAMPNYLYAPSPNSGPAPSVSSGASGSASASTRHEGIFAVSAPHHSQIARNHRHSAGQPTGTLDSRRSAGRPPSGGPYHGGNPHSHANGSGNGMAVGDVLPPFPPWSMAWYAGHVSADGHAYTMVPPNGSGGGDWESDTLTSSGYAPYPHQYRPYPNHPSYPYGGGQPLPSPHQHSSSPAPQDPEAQAAALKAARLRALEREFGLKVDGRDPHHDGDEDDDDVALLEKGGNFDGDHDVDPDEALSPGSINSEGQFVHRHPKMRKAVGIALLLLCILAFAIGAGGAYLIKLPANTLPSTVPAKGSIGSYLLYVLSFLCLALSFYLFCIRPCCVEPMRRRRINNAALVGGGGVGGLGGHGFVVPVMSGGMGMGMGGKPGKPPKMPKGRRGKGGMFGKKGQQGMMAPAPTVNLIVDPRAMMGAGGMDDDDDDSSDEEEQEMQARMEKDGLSGPENVDLAGLIGGRLGNAVDGSPYSGAGNNGNHKPMTKKQRKRARRAARLRAINAASRRALFLPLVLSSLRTQAVWLTVQSVLWLLAVIACLVPLFRSTQSSTVTFTDAASNQTSQRTLNSTRTALGASCLPRMGGGWCDAYNGARAAGVIAMCVCMGLAGWAMQELGMAKKMARREGAGFRVR
ncbi:hypothetical protein A4X13_0g3762 [Tilletia indica]|uniref:Uncharacterized protein n=1 Tax=Tilletia indica TaxID=43049 RepID=A0A177TQC6_9BASI|nr:hypothetical protein A4X13_0g3762 [Tilletia indica]